MELELGNLERTLCMENSGNGARTKPVVKVLWHMVFKNNSRITVISKSTDELEPHGAVTISPLAQWRNLITSIVRKLKGNIVNKSQGCALLSLIEEINEKEIKVKQNRLLSKFACRLFYLNKEQNMADEEAKLTYPQVVPKSYTTHSDKF